MCQATPRSIIRGAWSPSEHVGLPARLSAAVTPRLWPDPGTSWNHALETGEGGPQAENEIQFHFRADGEVDTQSEPAVSVWGLL